MVGGCECNLKKLIIDLRVDAGLEGQVDFIRSNKRSNRKLTGNVKFTMNDTYRNRLVTDDFKIDFDIINYTVNFKIDAEYFESKIYKGILFVECTEGRPLLFKFQVMVRHLQ